jgi:hypothetical protein
MSGTRVQPQAPRNATATVAMTEEEKRALRAVAAARGITESDALRDYTIAQLLQQFERIRIVAEDDT